MSHSHVSLAFACNFHPREDRADMSKVFQILLLSMLLFPFAALISLAMSLLQHGSLPGAATDTHTHFLAFPRRPHTLEEATYTGRPVGGGIGGVGKGFGPPPPTLIQINMREHASAGALGHADMGPWAGGSTYLSWCTPHGGSERVHEN